MRNKWVGATLREMADLMEILGEDDLKAPSYRRAAHGVEGFPADVDDLRREGRLREIPGVGPNLAKKITEMLDIGTCELLEHLRQRVPEGVRLLLEVPGIGPRTAGALHRVLGIDGPDELAEAARDGRLLSLPGMGEKKVAAILDSLSRLREIGRRFPAGRLLPLAGLLAEQVGRFPGVAAVHLAGSLRRRAETAGNIDLVVAGYEPAALAAELGRLPGARRLPDVPAGRVSLFLEAGVQVDFAVVPPAALPTALAFWTGSTAHWARLAGLAREQGFRLAAEGLTPLGAGGPLDLSGEEDLYRRLGLPFIPPELREDGGEVEAALAGRLPQPLEVGHLLGDLHMHTTWSDGADTLEAMALAARDRGYQYIAISEHSRSLAVARGLSMERLREQGEVIGALNRRLYPFRILWSTEVDIMRDGSLDFPDELLAELDFVTASVHTHFRLGREEMTRRIVTACQNPHVDAIGHLTGRLLGRREGYEVDLDAVLEAASAHGTALEINASPDRLDLSAENARLAAGSGVPLVINTDAHAVASLADMEWGAALARRAWVEPRHVLNTLPLDHLLAHLAARS